jgi:predicted enzyme related to lactoylglutathione lyase
MPERDSYADGVPCWVDLASPDPEASARFYGELFGWDAGPAGPPEDTGGYLLFRQDGRPVAGAGPLRDASQPAAWTTYLNVDDADATAARATAAGGRVVVEPFDLLDAGRMALLLDAVGAVIGLWEPRRHTGAKLVNEPVSLCWNELACRDTAAAAAFYAAVAGWEASTMDAGGDTITVFARDGAPVAGMRAMGDEYPAQTPSHWMTSFAVADVDATAARAEELGGAVSAAPFDAPPVGRVAVLTDPYGTAFSTVALASAG